MTIKSAYDLRAYLLARIEFLKRQPAMSQRSKDRQESAKFGFEEAIKAVDALIAYENKESISDSREVATTVPELAKKKSSETL